MEPKWTRIEPENCLRIIEIFPVQTQIEPETTQVTRELGCDEIDVSERSNSPPSSCEKSVNKQDDDGADDRPDETSTLARSVPTK
jgi:hypothetical protein